MTADPRIDQQAATRLLHYATGSSRQAWSALTSRLRHDDGHGWARVRLGSLLDAAAGDPRAVRLDRVLVLKESAKARLASADDLETQAAAWLGYATAVALAATVHGQMVSSMPAEAWVEVFAELSALMPEPWAKLFEQAIAWMVERDGPG